MSNHFLPHDTDLRSDRGPPDPRRPPMADFHRSSRDSSFPSSASSTSSWNAAMPQDNVLSILSSCGLEPDDLGRLAELPEDVLTVDALPHILQQMKGGRAEDHHQPSSSSSSFSSYTSNAARRTSANWDASNSARGPPMDYNASNTARGPPMDYNSSNTARGPPVDYNSSNTARGPPVDYNSSNTARGPPMDYNSSNTARGPPVDYNASNVARGPPVDYNASNVARGPPMDYNASNVARGPPVDYNASNVARGPPVDYNASNVARGPPVDYNASNVARGPPVDYNASNVARRTPVDYNASNATRRPPADYNSANAARGTPADYDASNFARRTPADWNEAHGRTRTSYGWAQPERVESRSNINPPRAERQPSGYGYTTDTPNRGGPSHSGKTAADTDRRPRYPDSKHRSSPPRHDRQRRQKYDAAPQNNNSTSTTNKNNNNSTSTTNKNNNSTNNSQPSKKQALDFQGTPPAAFPYACSLCDITVMSVKVWLQHVNSTQHADGQLNLLQQFPNWDCRIESSRDESDLARLKDGGRHAPSVSAATQQSGKGAERKDRGKVVCAKFPPQSVDETYLRKLIEPFGKIVKILMFPSLAFVELSSVDQAKDLVKFHVNYPPTVNGKQIEFSISNTFSFLQSSHVVSFTPSPFGENSCSDLISIVKRFGPLLYSLFLPTQACVEMKNVADAQKLVDYYSANTLRIKNSFIKVSFSADYKSLARVAKAKNCQETSSKRSDSSSPTRSKRRRRSNSSESSKDRERPTRSRSKEPTRTQAGSETQQQHTPKTQSVPEAASEQTKEGTTIKEELMEEKKEVEIKEEEKKEVETKEEETKEEETKEEETKEEETKEEETKEEETKEEETKEEETKEEETQEEMMVEEEEDAGLSVGDSDIEGMEVMGEDDEGLEVEDEAVQPEETEITEKDEGGAPESEPPKVCEDALKKAEEEEEEEKKDGRTEEEEEEKELEEEKEKEPGTMAEVPMEEEEDQFPLDLENCITLDELGEEECEEEAEQEGDEARDLSRVLSFTNLPRRFYTDAQFIALVGGLGTAVRYQLDRNQQEGFLEMASSLEAVKAAMALCCNPPTLNSSTLNVLISHQYNRLPHGLPVQPEDNAESRNANQRKRKQRQSKPTQPEQSESKEPSVETITETSPNNEDPDSTPKDESQEEEPAPEKTVTSEPEEEVSLNSEGNAPTEAGKTAFEAEGKSTSEAPTPTKPVGSEFVKPVVGYFCNLCQMIFTSEDEAKLQHCSTTEHYRRYQEKTGSDPWTS